MSGFEARTLPPGALFVEGDEPLLVFPSISEAEACLEATDVEDGVYRTAYGPQGQPFEIHVEGQAVRIRARAGNNRPDALKALLIRYFEACGDPADEDEPLDVLVSRAWAIEHDHWERCGEGRARSNIPTWAYVTLILLAGAGLYLLVS